MQEVCSHILKLHKKYWREYWIQDTNVTGVGQFLRLVRGDEFGSCHMGFDRKTEVILTRLRTWHVELNAYLYRFNMRITDKWNFCKLPEDVEHRLKYSASKLVLFDQLHSLGLATLRICLWADSQW